MMVGNINGVARLSAVALAVSTLVLPMPRAQAEDRGYRIADGIAVYLAAVPAAIIAGQHRLFPPKQPTHDASAGDEHSYHLVVAAFDDATGTRLTNMAVTAKILSPTGSSSTVSLKKMDIEGATAYGNFVTLARYGTYRIAVEILRHGRKTPAVAMFTYSHRSQ